MKKSILYLASCLLAVVLFTACGGGKSATPSDKAKDCIELLKNYDYETLTQDLYFAEDVSAEEQEQTKEMLTALFNEKLKPQIESHGGIASYEIVSEEISEDGTTAVVKAVYTYGDGTTEEAKYDMVNDNGEWKLSLNK